MVGVSILGSQVCDHYCLGPGLALEASSAGCRVQNTGIGMKHSCPDFWLGRAANA